MLGLMDPNSKFLRPLLSLLNQTDAETDHGAQLITNFGVPSLSPKDPLFGEGENYWRGNIGGNMNFLIMCAMSKTAEGSELIHGKFAKTVTDAYHAQGTFFEHYHP